MFKFILAILIGIASATVLDLNKDSFYSVVNGDADVLVELVYSYAPWCGHCKNFESTYNSIDEAFDYTNKLKIAKIDVSFELLNYDVIEIFQLAIKLFKKDSEIVDYKDRRDFDNIINFINQQVGIKPMVEESNVIELDGGNYQSLTDGKTTLIEFYVPWCKHCKAVEPIYTELSKIFKYEDNCQIAKLNVDNKDNKEIVDQFNVSGYPTFNLVKNEEKHIYNKARTLDHFLKFLNEHCKTDRDLNGELGDKAGVNHEYNAIIVRFLCSNNQQRLEIIETLNEISDKVYLRVMSKIISDGVDYLSAESNRLNNLLATNLRQEQKDKFKIKSNILTHFGTLLAADHHQHSEL
ncbi:thioredoxin-like protein [Wallemia mellicola]|uniref:protein disulfide-isomerase n=1 Tax=Wallemia mellicola TaxID=1708541 RepID=A0AB74KEC4_9BASI|nr:thioredoxin-like protein [Wallemia mellicola]